MFGPKRLSQAQLLTTPQANWVAVLLNKGIDPVLGEAIIPRSVYDAVITAQSIMSGHPTPQRGVGIVGYGMGWTRWTYDGIEVTLTPNAERNSRSELSHR